MLLEKNSWEWRKPVVKLFRSHSILSEQSNKDEFRESAPVPLTGRIRSREKFLEMKNTGGQTFSIAFNIIKTAFNIIRIIEQGRTSKKGSCQSDRKDTFSHWRCTGEQNGSNFWTSFPPGCHGKFVTYDTVLFFLLLSFPLGVFQVLTLHLLASCELPREKFLGLKKTGGQI